MMKISYEIGPAPMEYLSRDEHEILALGSYRALGFIILNMYGKYPCAYVDVHGTRLDGVHHDSLDIDVHGGLTYSGNGTSVVEGGWWLGWDYAHAGDMYVAPALPKPIIRAGRMWRTSEIVSDCVSVIDQVLKRTKGKENA